MNAITCTQVTKTFGDLKALDQVTLSFEEGKIYGLLGRNGAGKTTLARLLCALEQPQSGNITINTIPVARQRANGNMQSLKRADREKLRATIGYVMQHPERQLFAETVAEDIAYGPRNQHLDETQVSERVNQAMTLLHIEHLADRSPFDLSGGQQRLAAIAGIIACQPQILIMDEPTAGLDPKERVRFRNLISDFAKEKIVILSTHIVSDVSYIADTILMMKDGTFLLQEPMATVTDSINGKVWELLVRDREAAEYSNRFSVVNLHHENGKVRLRMIHDTAPTADAITVPPSLEDLFLYHFGEEAGEERGE